MKLYIYIIATGLLLTLGADSAFSASLVENYNAGPVAFRSNNGSDYFFSNVAVEGPRAGYYPEEARFGLLPLGTPGTNTLYRCTVTSKASEHFISTDSRCEGRVVEGTL